ncbi:MAG: amidophosphoribosyltransferase [Alphaproteobacteria bacterium]|nr:amidophosphoribosyltransferase [Alphaproteobacteria bacterium]
MCGFVGMIAHEPVAGQLLLALQAIQHRGQDAAGVATREGGRFNMVKDLGLIAQAVPTGALRHLGGRSGIAHVRYPTAGEISTREDAQPFMTRFPGIILAHNGNVTNVPELIEDLRSEGHHVLSRCDAEPLLLVLAQELIRRRPSRHTTKDLVEAVAAVFRRVRGAYSVVAILEIDGQETLVAFRDPHGVRPGVYGHDGQGAWMAASESVALDVAGFTRMGDLPPGEVLLLRRGEEPVRLAVQRPTPRPCVFERIYFARPDSVMEDGRVNRTRWRLGRQLAVEWARKGLSADIIVPIPDTSRPAAWAMAEALKIKHREGFIKNRYTGRTFIMPDQKARQATLRLKLNPIREFFEGQRVILVDDSIVRGTTMRRIVSMVRELNPLALHVAIISPAVRHPCFYGIDMPSQEELAAAAYPLEKVEEAMARRLGADSVTYLSDESLRAVAGEGICAACFDGDYVVPVSEAEREAIRWERRGRGR